MTLHSRRMELDFKEVRTVKPLSKQEALAVINGCSDPVFGPFAREIYTQVHNNFQPQNGKLLVGFRNAASKSPVFLINCVQPPFNGVDVGAVMNPPVGIRANFPTINTNGDGTLNIEIKYDIIDTGIRSRSPPVIISSRRDERSASRSHSRSPPRRKRSPDRTRKPVVTASSSISDEEKIASGRSRRSLSVAREMPPPRASSKSRGRSVPKKKKKQSSSSEEEKKGGGGLFSFWSGGQ